LKLFTLLAFSLVCLGLPTFFLGYIATIIQAFRKNLGWGFASLFVPFILFLFTAMHWKDTRKSALVMYLGLLCHIVGFGLAAVLAAMASAN
jgi:FtsH-binding integral membrane protein